MGERKIGIMPYAGKVLWDPMSEFQVCHNKKTKGLFRENFSLRTSIRKIYGKMKSVSL